MARRWTGPICIEDEQTGDGRVMVAGSARWENLPLALRWDREDDGGHYGAVLVGSVESIVRDGNQVIGSGMIDDAPGSMGAELCRLMDEGLHQGWVSVDPDDVAVEVVDTQITAAEMEEAQEAIAALFASAGDADPGNAPEDVSVIYEYETGEIVERWITFRIRGVTVCDITAFDTARIKLDAADESLAASSGMLTVAGREPAVVPSPFHACSCGGVCGACSLTAAAGQLVLNLPCSAEAFAPSFSELTPVETVEIGGVRTFAGHIAPWGACHLGSGINGCVTAPRGAPAYAAFNRRPARTVDGVELRVGPISMTGRHVEDDRVWDGIDILEDVETIVGWAVAGTDRFGPWIAGVLDPALPETRLRQWLSAEPSGDWRNVGGALYLSGVHAVVDPGFVTALVASGRTVRLSGAGAREMATLRRARAVTRGMVAGLALDEDRLREIVGAAVGDALSAAERAKLEAERQPHVAVLRKLGTEAERDKLRKLAAASG